MRKTALLVALALAGFLVAFAAAQVPGSPGSSSSSGSSDTGATTTERASPPPPPRVSRAQLVRRVVRTWRKANRIRGCRMERELDGRPWKQGRSRLERELRQWKRTVARFDRRPGCVRLERRWHRALRIAAATFGVSYRWLHSCNHSEGTHSRTVWNRAGSGARGHMQFMSATFYSNVRGAFEVARARGGPKIPRRYARRTSSIGQAFTAAYMFSKGGSSHWTGSGC